MVRPIVAAAARRKNSTSRISGTAQFPRSATRASCQTGRVVRVIEVLGTVVVCAGLLWLARRIEPHWASKDGHRFVGRVQVLGTHDLPEGPWREIRASVDDGTRLVVTARGLGGRGLGGNYRVASASPSPPRGKAVFVLVGEKRLVLRVPATSRARPVLDSLVGAS